MKKTAMAIGIVAALFVVTASLALAWGPGYGRGAGYAAGLGYNRCFYAPNVNLTADQTAKFTTRQQTFLNEILPLRNELAAKTMELRTLMAQPEADVAKITAKQRETFALQQKLQEKSMTYQLDSRSILTPQQLTALPPGCGLGFASGTGYGRAMNYGAGYGRGMGRGAGFGRTW